MMHRFGIISLGILAGFAELFISIFRDGFILCNLSTIVLTITSEPDNQLGYNTIEHSKR